MLTKTKIKIYLSSISDTEKTSKIKLQKMQTSTTQLKIHILTKFEYYQYVGCRAAGANVSFKQIFISIEVCVSIFILILVFQRILFL